MRFLTRNLLAFVTILVGLLVLERIHEVLTPFFLAAVLAYLLSPLVRLAVARLHISRVLAVLLVYSSIIAILSFFVTQMGILFAQEYQELNKQIQILSLGSGPQLEGLPEWGKEVVVGIFETINPANLLSRDHLLPYFSGAVSRLESVFIFLIATFYFLKDGPMFASSFTEGIFGKRKKELEGLFPKIYEVLNNYLRGQIFLIILMSLVSWITLFALGVKYALILGIFTGIAEIIPIIGPVIAASAAIGVGMFDGVASLGLPPVGEAALIGGIYFVYRQLEDIFIIPYVLGRATKLHPLVILFSVLVGGHIWGVFGMILAVPAAALMRVVFEYLEE